MSLFRLHSLMVRVTFGASIGGLHKNLTLFLEYFYYMSGVITSIRRLLTVIEACLKRCFQYFFDDVVINVFIWQKEG